MIERIPPHILKLSKKHPAIRRQFFKDKSLEKVNHRYQLFDDPLLEEEHTTVKGLVHKYRNRALIALTFNCSAFCQFCTRQRTVGSEKYLKEYRITEEDVAQMVEYLKNHKEIEDVIFSGGDPLVAPIILKYALKKISSLPGIKIIRINSRVPVTNPSIFPSDILSIFKKIKQPVYFGLHFEHPAEITAQTEAIIESLKKAGCILYSQSVFLRGVNDDYKTLYELFTRLTELGVMPYYIYRCDYVKGAERFIVDFDREVEIMTKLRKDLSGLACPVYVIDAPDGSGKVPVPLNFWRFDKKKFRDFNNKTIILWEKIRNFFPAKK